MKGIMFKEDLFRAVVEGRKTETRRVVKGVPPNCNHKMVSLDLLHPECLFGEVVDGALIYLTPKSFKPRYLPGEVVYLKEPWCACESCCGGDERTCYKFDGDMPNCACDWRNKMFMPEHAARHFIRVTGVRCERLQDADMAAAVAEGCIGSPTQTPLEEFEELWDSINKQRARWLENPGVWVYQFELSERPT